METSSTVLLGVVIAALGVVVIATALTGGLRARRSGSAVPPSRSLTPMLLGLGGFVSGVAVLVLATAAPAVLDARLPDALGTDWRRTLPAVGGSLAVYAFLLAWTAGRVEEIRPLDTDDAPDPAPDSEGADDSVQQISLFGRSVVRLGSRSADDEPAVESKDPSDDDRATQPGTGAETDAATEPDRTTVASPLPTDFDTLREEPPELPSTASDTVTGAQLDATVRRALATAGRSGAPHSPRLRDTLRTLAIDVERVVHGRTPDAVESEIERGAWTDDPVVSAFLATDVPLPFRARVRAVVRPEAHVEAQLLRTARVIEQRRTADQGAR